jgi:uncharacterized coiled-coil protein SlyX
MTKQIADEAMERWPNYTEQSWAERFAELDKAFNHQQAVIDGLVRQVTTQAAKLAEKDAEISQKWVTLLSIMDSNTKETGGPDRVFWKGVWYDGPMAEAYHSTFNAIREFARQAALKPERPDHD